MKPSPRRIIALWRNNPDWRASLKDIREAFGSSKAQMPKLKSLLDDLVANDKLTYERHRFQIARPTAPSPKAQRTPLMPSPGLTGVYSAHRDGYGFVAIEQSEQSGQSVFIPPRKEGGALDGDSVQVVMEKRRGSERTSGKIIAVTKRGRTKVRGFVHQERRELWLLPLNEKLPMVFLEPGGAKAKYSREDLVEAEFLTYPPDSRTAPAGRVLRVLPSPDAPQQIVDNILADSQIPTAFSKQTMREMADLDTGAAPAGGGREDLSDLPFVTIDGADARDFDDAVCLIKDSGGHRRLMVAIADVAHFVRPGSAVDEDAYGRGTSVYFPERVVPMLPELLSNDLCSLKPEVPRLTLVCEMTLDGKGGRTDYRIFEAVIRSHARLTYEQVQSFLDSGKAAELGLGAPQGAMLKDMLALSETLAENRSQRGALGFEFPEARFAFSAPGKPEAIHQALPTQATRLIEQFMLEANETVAWHCETKGIPILYRVHDPPPPDQLAQLRLQLVNFGVTVTDKEFEGPGAINSLLARLESHPAREEIWLMILKSMSQAQYRSRNDGHFGLAATHYAHFTSPIRRYPDLQVHRALKSSLAAGGTPEAQLKDAGPGDAGPTLSMRERRAAGAESQVARLYRVLYMEGFVGQEFEATVSGIGGRGLWVRPREHFVEGLLPMALLPDDRYRFDARRGVLRPSRGKRIIAFGQRMTVQLIRAERLSQELEFGFAGWDWKDEEAGKSGT